jgi:ATP adenylyltransferase
MSNWRNIPALVDFCSAAAILGTHMDHLWTPWRYAYITRSDPQARTGVAPELSAWPAAEDKHCVFCNMIAATDYAIAHGMPVETAERASHLVHRGTHCFVCLNVYPYATGHVLILPYLHIDSLAAAPPDAAHEIIDLAQTAERALRTTYRPDGINLGMNLGEAAGAGIAGHIHMHVLPRWIGDTNFMTVTAETRVLPEALDITWKRLREAFGNDATPRPMRTSKKEDSL